MQWQSNSLSAPDHYRRGKKIWDQKHVEAEDLNLADMIRFLRLLIYCQMAMEVYITVFWTKKFILTESGQQKHIELHGTVKIMLYFSFFFFNVEVFTSRYAGNITYGSLSNRKWKGAVFGAARLEVMCRLWESIIFHPKTYSRCQHLCLKESLPLSVYGGGVSVDCYFALFETLQCFMLSWWSCESLWYWIYINR